jgi:uncharacterized lipoprotein YajG
MNAKAMLLTVLLCVLFLGGCAGRAGVGSSFVGQIPSEGIDPIVQDATNQLVELYPPGRTSIKLLAPEQSASFSQSFENNLRKQGFTLSPRGEVVISYVLDALRGVTPSVWYLQLRIVDHSRTMTLARSYTADGKPVAGFSCLKSGGDSNE